MEDKNTLWKLYMQRDKEFERAKLTRSILVYLLFVLLNAILVYFVTSGESIIGSLIVSAVVSAIRFFIDAPIIIHLYERGMSENKQLEAIKQRIRELEK